jgi:hypothetical protein
MTKEEEMKRRLGRLSTLSILVVTSVLAQSKPDFSGRWVLLRPESAGADVARTVTVRQPIVRANVHGAPMEPSFLQITLERHFARFAQTDTYLIGVQGGTVGGLNAGGSRRSTRVFARWEGDRLVIDTSSTSDGESAERTEVLQYDVDGLLTVTVTERSSGVESRRMTATYRRN